MKQEMTLIELKKILSYDPITGEFTWIRSPSSKVPGNSRAGFISSLGYRLIGVFGRRYIASRLAFFYMTGRWPADQMDHKNCDSTDDRWTNLREATPLQNQGNKRARLRRNVGSLKGTCFFSRTGRWKSSLTVARKTKHLGYFDTEREAHNAYVTAAKSYFGEFAREGNYAA